jgi:hypothetical protein
MEGIIARRAGFFAPARRSNPLRFSRENLLIAAEENLGDGISGLCGSTRCAIKLRIGVFGGKYQLRSLRPIDDSLLRN